MKKDDLIRTLDEYGDRLTAAASALDGSLLATEGGYVGPAPDLDPLLDEIRRLAHDLRFEDVVA